MPGDAFSYPDRGCNLAPSCLKCHLPVCKFDLPREKGNTVQRKNAQERADRIMHLREEAGMTVREIVAETGWSTRTINRVLERRR